MGEIDYKTLKKGGFMRQKQPGYFSMRLKAVGGQYTTEQLLTIKKVADTYGKGYIHLTSRQGIEIPFIHADTIDTVKAALAEGGVEVGVCGPRVRTITACQGSAVCPTGLIDTTRLAEELDKRYGGRELPHKFKFGLTGCHNNCLKTEENDLGIKGGLDPKWIPSHCIFCGLCQAVCIGKAITVDKQERTLAFDRSKCLYCGKCVQNCPVGAWDGERGYVVSIGGMYGNRISIGKTILPIIFDDNELFAVIDTVLAFFEKNARPGERSRTMLDRIGWDKLEDELKKVTGKTLPA
ncbi:MAG: 4Fe-4S binding protein [Acidaminococcaceae bacterium]|nr:4Fe-4S binding protein [Acidaminococcaceae bacterium]